MIKGETEMDKLAIENLEVFAYHGVYEEEINLGQKFLVSAVLYFDAAPAATADDLTKSVNYADVCSEITEWMKTNRCRLIETVAQRLALKLLKEHGVVRSVDVTIKKPWAPIGLPLECVSITISRAWHTVFLSIGSNMGDRRKYLTDGVAKLASDDNIRILKESELIETAPYGKTDQDDFLNGVVKLETLLSPYELLDVLHKVENAAGRIRREHWGPRTLDLDILLYDEITIAEDDLVIPHPDMANRDFVLRVFKEIAPNVIHPVLGKSISQLFTELNC